MEAETAGRFLRDCEDLFMFAVADYGLKPGQLGHDEKRRRLRVLFAGREIGLECDFDYFDRDAALYIVRLHDGEEPKRFWAEDGQRVRASLYEILEHRGDITFSRKDMSKSERRRREQMDDRTYWRTSLENEVARLKEYGQDILNDDPSCFDDLPPVG